MFNTDSESKLIGGIIGTAISMTGYTISLDTVNQIVSIVCSVLGILITFISVVVIPFIKKWKAAKEDGKVTVEEIEDIIDDTKKNIDEFKGDK